MHLRPRGTTRRTAPTVQYASFRAPAESRPRAQPEGTVTADETPGHDPDRAVRDAERERERAASRARQQAAYQRAQRASRSRALRAAAGHVEPARPAADVQQGSTSTAPPFLGDAWLVRALLQADDPRDRPPTELTAIALVEQRLEEAELQGALLEALASLPTDQRVAVVAALGYAEGPAGAAMELDLDPPAAEQLAQQGLDALRHALSPFLTRSD